MFYLIQGEVMIESISGNKPEQKPKKYYMTAQVRGAHVGAYKAGNESISAYCDKHHLSQSTFRLWLSMYGGKKEPAHFIPVTLSQKNDMGDEKPKVECQRVEMIFDDIKIVLSDINNINIIIQLVKGLSHANKTQCANGIVLQ